MLRRLEKLIGFYRGCFYYFTNMLTSTYDSMQLVYATEPNSRKDMHCQRKMEVGKNETIRDMSMNLSHCFGLRISGSTQNSVQGLIPGHCPMLTLVT